MQRILLIETSSRVCSVALAIDGMVSVEQSEQDPNGFRHAEALNPMISAVLAQAGMRVRDLSAIGAAQGPGSYTGLRIGLSTAKGLAAPWDLPCYGVSSLELIAEAVLEVQGAARSLPIWAGMDARRMEVYQASFTADGRRSSVDEPAIVDGSWAQRPEMWGGGDGVEKTQHWWPGLRDSGVRYAQARHALRPVLRALGESVAEDLATWEPRYLKAFGQVL